MLASTTSCHIEHPSLLNLPTELFESILNDLSDHYSSLASCCLVSRAFLPTAQALLFRRVELRFHVYPQRPRAGTRLRHLVELSHLLNYTREFQINGIFDISTKTWLNEDSELLPALEAFITIKNSHMTTHCGNSLQYISLENINWDMSSSNSLNAALQRLLALESVTHIRISWNNMPLDIFQHFPSGVKILEVENPTFQNSVAAPVSDGHPKLVSLPAIRLESLMISPNWNPGELAGAIFNNPTRACDGTSIRTLGYIASKVVNAIAEFETYVTFAPHVENLSIWSARKPYDFSQLSRLRCLSMRMREIGTDYDIRWLAQSLRHLKIGNSFRSITLIICLFFEMGDVLAWFELDSVLAGSQFESESFSGMTIQVPKKLSSMDFYSLLPRTNDKKLLKVVMVNTL